MKIKEAVAEFRRADKLVSGAVSEMEKKVKGTKDEVSLNAIRMALYYEYLALTLEGLEAGQDAEAFVNTDKVTEALIADDAGAHRLQSEYIPARNEAPQQKLKSEWKQVGARPA